MNAAGSAAASTRMTAENRESFSAEEPAGSAQRRTGLRLTAADITIAVTVFRRLDYLEGALASAVQQTVPVRVLLVDDGCQDLARLTAIREKFGARVEYRRNPATLGLFRNMNACIQHCTTEWLSILHDDDRLAENFVEKILAAVAEVPDCALFFGGTVYLRPDGTPFHRLPSEFEGAWRPLDAHAFAYRTRFSFPGHLMHAPTARESGGFPAKSLYTGDWELWFRLTQARGAVELGADLGFHRLHLGADRGTTAAAKSGRKAALCAMQVKRNLSRLRRAGQPSATFDRGEWLRHVNLMYRDLLVYAWSMPAWLLRYNRTLLLRLRPPGRLSRLLHLASRLGGNPALRLAALGRMLAERLGVKMPQPF
jgi:hypothetical protein